MNTPLLSVCLITYNHKDFISEAIEGVIMQKTNFKIELIIADDCSTDGTIDIINKYREENPNLIRIIQQEKNIGPAKNWLDLMNSPNPNSKYISYFEGDDYWTDPLKLQKQVDFLETNPDYGICFHNVAIFDEANQKIIEDNITREVRETTDISELAKGNYMHTPSVMLRNDFLLPTWFKDVTIGDWPLYMLAIKDRKIKKLEEVMAVYRKNNTGVYSNKNSLEKYKMTIGQFAPILNSGLFKPTIISIINQYCLRSCNVYLKKCIKVKDREFIVNFINSLHVENVLLIKELNALFLKNKINNPKRSIVNTTFIRVKRRIKYIFKYF